MAKIDRFFQKVFASSASNNGVFGSAQLGTKVLSNDPDTIMGLAAWLSGWNSATISGERLPTLEEMQGIQYVVTRQLAYILQEGIPEYDPSTTYYEYSVVKEAGSYNIYGSITDDNIGNALSVNTEWQYLGNLADLASLVAAEVDIASAGTTNIGGVSSTNVRITGTTTITSFGTAPAGVFRKGRFAAALTLTHNGTSLILPNNGSNITTAANDRFEAFSLGSGNWIVTRYQKSNGQQISVES